MNKKILIFSLLVLVALFFVFKPTGNIIENEDSVKIPLSELSQKASYYEFEGTKYFVVLAQDGSIKVAFDACDVCYGAHKGYRQEGTYMVCNNCGNKYPIQSLGTENLRGGGCWPGYLESKTEGDYLVIKKSNIEAGSYRF